MKLPLKKKTPLRRILNKFSWPWQKKTFDESSSNSNNNNNNGDQSMSFGYLETSYSQTLSEEEKSQMWQFHSLLKCNPRALVRFIRSVNWQDEMEVKQAISAILEWEPIEACDALELLGPAFSHPFVRCYALWRIQKTASANVLLYLPQLVQALRYESRSGDCSMKHYFGLKSLDLASFLIWKACMNNTAANFFYWYLTLEMEVTVQANEQMAQMFAIVMERLKKALSTGNKGARRMLKTLEQQRRFVDELVLISKQAAEGSGNRGKRLDILKDLLAENKVIVDLKGMMLPLDPSIRVKSIDVDTTILYSSNLMPMRLTFRTMDNKVYVAIFKRGDDLRQDQLVTQMIRLMDSLLKERKLDLCLTPYAVLATSLNEGFVQYVEATPLAELKCIQSTLRLFRPSVSGPFGICPGAMQNYVRSCAGYSIICYILGIGDRHLHNLLLAEDGRVFHVDFGYILGRDPKPMPPAMKLTSEMVNAMGGQSSAQFKEFVDYCTAAFSILRRHANLICNLFSLMLDAGIPDIALEKEKAIQKLLDRFQLDLSDEDACQLVHMLIGTSISAKMSLLIDFVHDVRQYMAS